MDQQYENLRFNLSAREHRYGEGVFLVQDPYLLTRLARLCSPQCIQPEINRLIGEMYRSLGQYVASCELPRTKVEIPTRMQASHPEGVYSGEVLSRDTSVVFVGLARAGTLPAIQMFETFSSLLNPSKVRVDHIFMNRAIDEQQHVTGAAIHASKVGGPIDGSIVILPDPMGATGNSMCNVIDLYKKTVVGKPKRWISLNLIVTPEFIRKMKSTHPEVAIYALRLDRGFSSKRALASLPGEYWDEEKGLNDHQYIVPGGGGFGEISSNSFV